MKIDKDDLYIYGFISGLIICSPLISVYYGTKWIYNHTPQKVKEKKERDLKIHELEEKLGLIGLFIMILIIIEIGTRIEMII